MARTSIRVCDFSGNEIPDARRGPTITVRFGDGRRGVLVADAHADDPIIAEIARVGRQQARRGRRLKAESV
jgi:hypothetical protein